MIELKNEDNARARLSCFIFNYFIGYNLIAAIL
jgi:hypothetical protein